MMIENLIKCQHNIDFIRADLLEIINAGDAVDFLMVENLLHKTMGLKRDIERYLTAKEVDDDKHI